MLSPSMVETFIWFLAKARNKSSLFLQEQDLEIKKQEIIEKKEGTI
jgi:hypothetical protein